MDKAGTRFIGFTGPRDHLTFFNRLVALDLPCFEMSVNRGKTVGMTDDDRLAISGQC